MDNNLDLEKLRKQEQLKHLKNLQMPEAQVFYEKPGDETLHALYGTPKIGHWGFDSIEGFTKGINNLKKEIEDYNTLLTDTQVKLKAIIQDMNLYQKHPEIALPGEIEDLKNEYDYLMDKKNRILEKKTKEEKNLEILIKAKEEYNKNRINSLKSEDDKEKASLLNQLAAAEREMKNLEIKIKAGTANNFEKERYEVLKNEIIPELLELINKNKVEEKDDNPEEEIVEEKDGSEITKDSKFKKLAKRVLKAGIIAGGVALVAGAVYQLFKGDATPISDIIQTGADAVQNIGNSVNPEMLNLDSTTVGTVYEVFNSNMEALQNINPETPLEPYFQNEILGFSNSNNELVPAQTVGDIVDAYNNGENITSVYVGNENGIDGFVNKINNTPLPEFLESYSKGGPVR